jgi:hypothetical protein
MAKPHPIHIENLLSNITEVQRLVEIHATLTGSARGRRHNVAILNKSGIVLVVACWEAFVEDLASHAFAWLLEKADSPAAFPRKVLSLSCKELREAQDANRVWELAGTGWRTVLARHRETVLKRSTGRLNTPRPKEVDELFSDLLGMASISSCWKWHNVPNDRIKQNLDDLVTLRGEIAHRVESSRPVVKKDVVAATDLVQRLAVTSSNIVRQFLLARGKGEPWGTYNYGVPR